MRDGIRLSSWPIWGLALTLGCSLSVGNLWAGESSPSWVKRFPYDPDLYIGIGFVDKRQHLADYRELAQTAALAQISREISIQVKAENSSTQSETGQEWVDKYQQRISTTSQNDLFGYQLADVYETETGYWALYTLDKDVFARNAEAKEKEFLTWLDREVILLESELANRLIQKAVDRYSNIRSAYTDFRAHNTLACSYSPKISEKLREIEERIQALVNRIELRAGPALWIIQMDNKVDSPGSGKAKLYLTDNVSGERWKGPIIVNLANANHPEQAVCPQEVDASGTLDLFRPFMECGLEPGNWVVTWRSPTHSPHLNIGVAWHPMDLSLDFRAKGVMVSENILTQIRSQLETVRSLYYRILPAQPGRSTMVVQLKEVVQDSLEGMYFTTLRASVGFPGKFHMLKLQGKSGHADKQHSLQRAIADFINGLQKLPFEK